MPSSSHFDHHLLEGLGTPIAELHHVTTPPQKFNRSRSSSLTSLESEVSASRTTSTPTITHYETPGRLRESVMKSVMKNKSILTPHPYHLADSRVSTSSVTSVNLTRSPKPSPKPNRKNKVTQKTPFPNFSHPTKSECELVCQILSDLNQDLPRRPENGLNEVVQDGQNVAQACGQVSNVLDALIRTILSQHTSNSNSSRAYSKIVEEFGYRNFEAIRNVGQKTLADTIRVGGLAERKAMVIIKLLDQVKLRGDGVLSLEYLRTMSDEEVMNELVAFDGVGVKTGACVSMFCLGRDIFPVDTHVFRLTKALGWVPPKATRDQTFYHLDQMIPNHLKYALHILLIQHGQQCRQCSPASKSPSSATRKGVKRKVEAVECKCPLKRIIDKT